MRLNDPELKRIVENKIPVEIKGEQYNVLPSPGMSCLGCVFNTRELCPPKATQICTSNRGNILTKVEHNV